MKQLKCCNVGFDCPAVVQASSEEEVLAQVAKHALEVHGVTVGAPPWSRAAPCRQRDAASVRLEGVDSVRRRELEHAAAKVRPGRDRNQPGPKVHAGHRRAVRALRVVRQQIGACRSAVGLDHRQGRSRRSRRYVIDDGDIDRRCGRVAVDVRHSHGQAFEQGIVALHRRVLLVVKKRIAVAHRGAIEPGDREKFVEGIELAKIGNQIKNLEIAVKKKSGELEYFQVTMDPERGTNGEIESVFGACQCVTERKALERKYQQAQKKFHRTLPSGSRPSRCS